MRITGFFCALIVATTPVFAVSDVAQAEPLRLRVGTYVPERSVGVQSVLIPWIEAVEADSGGKIEFVRYWGGSLGRNPYAQYELVRRGVLDLAWVLPGYTAGQFPQLGVVELPFLATDAESASVALWRIYSAGLVDGFDATIAITIWANDASALHLVGKNHKLDSLAGLRFRTTSAEAAQWIELIGATPQTMSAIDMNQALQRGGIDGLLQGWTGMRTFGTLFLTDSVIEVPAGSIAFTLLMNRDKWNSLPEDLQRIMRAHGGEGLARRGGAAYDRMAAEIREQTVNQRDYDLIEPPAGELQRHRQTALDLHAEWVERTPRGQETLALFALELEKAGETDE